jgi:hypothetical protein
VLADDRAMPMFTGLRTERLVNAIRLRDLRVEQHGDDVLTRGHVEYPEKMFIDETKFRLG